MKIRIGTRGSRLALAQTRSIAERLRLNGHEVSEVVIETRGDRDQEASFPEFGGSGVFVHEIERALLQQQIDLAVHSYKDLPATGPADLTIGAIPERLDAADCLLVREEVVDLDDVRLPVRRRARIGTGSARRTALLHWARSDLEILPLRGNVDTRVGKLMAGDYDAIVVAAAGLDRIEAAGGLQQHHKGKVRRCRLDPSWFVPAPAQGVLALQIRRADAELAAAVKVLHREQIARPVSCERQLLVRVEGNCQLPFGAWCEVLPGGGLALVFALGLGTGILVDRLEGEDPMQLADRAWNRLAEAGLPTQ